MSRPRRYVSWILAAAFAGCGGAGGDAGAAGADAEVTARLRAAADRMATAFSNMDLDVQVELTHPSIIAQFGGEAAYRRVLERGKASLAKVQPPKGRITGVRPVMVRDGRAYAFVDCELEMTNMSGVRGVLDSYFAAESTADGMSWRFLDGSQLQGSLEVLRKSVPAWPAELPPPKVSGAFRAN